MEMNNTVLAWLLIIAGGFLQLGWSIGLAYTNEFTLGMGLCLMLIIAGVVGLKLTPVEYIEGYEPPTE